VNQTRDPAGSSAEAHADVNGPATSLTKKGWPARRNETVFDRDETRLKPTPGGFLFGENSEVDHAGHHHQPLLSAVLQGGIVRHSNADPLSGFELTAQKAGAGRGASFALDHPAF
jgi:hypothetical protein